MKKPAIKEKIKYPLERSPLFKLSSKRNLAQLLGIDYKELVNFSRSTLPYQYCIFTDKNTLRYITEPKNELLSIHKRLLNLLTRLETPSYIHSATKKRSYKTNAEQHISSDTVIKIDIRKFFPSVKFEHIHSFFQCTLKCAPDISVILAKLCTVETKKYGIHLPTGSCISPLLSFLANQRLFNRIESLAAARGCIFTLYVDDITISGKQATRDLLTAVAFEIHNSGYGYHKFKIYKEVPSKITGLIISKGRLHLPHSRAKKIRELVEALDSSVGGTRPKLLASLVGRLSEAEQINPIYKTVRRNVMDKYRPEWKEIVRQRILKQNKTRKNSGG